MNSIPSFFLSTCTPTGWNSLGPLLRQECSRCTTCLLLSGPGCGGGELLQHAGEAAAAQELTAELLHTPVAPCLPEAVIFPERSTLAAIAAPFGGTVPPMPGPNEYYVNLTDCYDRAGLREIQAQTELCQKEEAQCVQRAARCLRAMEQLTEDIQATLLTASAQARMEKRAAGILSRELPPVRPPVKPTYRYLSAYTALGHIALFDTISLLCKRVYEIVDHYRLSHMLLHNIAAGASSSGYQTILCLSPLNPEKLEHVLIPELSLAFVTSLPTLPWPGEVSRRIHLDTMLDTELLHSHRGHLRFTRKVIASLLEECTTALTQAAELHQVREDLFAAYTDQETLWSLQNDTISSILAVSE